MRTWIFQANPDDFDINGYLATQPVEFLWLVTRYADSSVRAGGRIAGRCHRLVDYDLNLSVDYVMNS